MGASAFLSRPSRVILLVVAALSAFFLLGPIFFDSKPLAEYFGAKPNVNEVYGLLHLVTRYSGRRDMLTEVAGIDPTEPLDLAVYSGEKKVTNWNKEVKRLNSKYPIVVFSKTYCPYSQRAKKLLASYDIRPAPRIVEIDSRTDSSIIKAILHRLTDRSTVPNVLVLGKSIGGSDELQALHERQELASILRAAGVVFRVPEL